MRKKDVSKILLFSLSDISLPRFDSADFGPILEKNTFSQSWQLYTVTQDE